MIKRILADQCRRQIVLDVPSEARPPCIGDASPVPNEPSSQWTLTQALRCAGLSSGAQAI
jgi:hypothetical protein